MAVIKLNDKDFSEKVLKSKMPVMVDFYADWCGPCKAAEPVIEEVSEEYKDKLVVGKVNVDENQALAQKYGVMSIPTVMIFKEGEEAERMSGFAGKQGYVNLIEKVLGQKSE